VGENAPEGFIAFNLRSDALQKLCMMADESAGAVYFVDADGIVFFTNATDALAQPTEGLPSLQPGMVRGGNVVVSTPADANGIQIILQSEYPDFIAQQKANLWRAAFMMLSLLVAALGISLLLTVRFYGTISKIIAILQNPFAAEGDDGKTFDEINYISKSIISIVHRNSEIEVDLAQRISMLRHTQAVALATQLNPHFLFNSLHLISSMDMLANKRETNVTTALRLLSDIVRHAVDTTEMFVRLEEEIAYSEKYLEIQKLKYHDKISIEWDIAPQTRHLKLFKLSLQPILENALDHGIALSDKPGVVKIKSFVENDKLVLTITDNGVGMSAETLALVRGRIEQPTLHKKDFVGLVNTNQRIKLIFGDGFGCEINADTSGTVVKMVLPIIENE